MGMKERMAKYSGDIQKSIRKIALGGRLDNNGNVIGTARVYGYVCAIHGMDDENESLRNTVDVQEFNCNEEEYDGQPVGFHEGVLLSAVQGGNEKGVFIVPQLFSEVMIQQDPFTLQEYVAMYSHAKIIQMQSVEQVNIGVTEYEDFVETGDEGIEKDYNELEPHENKNKSNTTYEKDSIISSVANKDGEFVEETMADHKTITVGDTIITINGQNVEIQTSGNVNFTVGGTSMKVSDGSIDIETENATVKGDSVKVEGSQVEITGGQLTTKGTASTDLNGPFNSIKVCPFSGAPHCGSMVSGT